MASDREEKIRSRAYAIWEREGRPEGHEEQHWAQAEHEIENEDAAGADISAGVKVTTAHDPTRADRDRMTGASKRPGATDSTPASYTNR